MVEGKTQSGFEFQVTDERLNNFELLEIINEVDKNPLLVPKVVFLLLGEEQKNALYDHVRNEKGIVPTDKMFIEVRDILMSNNKTKNL